MILHPLIGEFLGTAVLTLLGGGAVATVLLKHSKGEGGGWIVITTGWFIAVVIGVFVAQSAGSPQADINPAITLAKTLLGIYTWALAGKIMLAETAGGFVGAIFVWLAFLPHWRETKNQDFKLLIFSTKPAIRHYPSNLLCEIIGTFVLVMGVGGIFGSATHHGHMPIGIAPYMVGLLVWGIGLSLGGQTGYAINPARDLGPRLAHQLLPIAGKGSSDWAYAWVPIIGPVVGALLGALVWRLVFH